MITFLLGFALGIIVGVVGLVCVAIMYDKHHPDDQKGERYADKEQKAERLRYGYLLSGAALSACPKNTVIADMVIENILHRKSYRKISRERYIPMNPKDFYGYRRKTVAVLYERMRLLGVWEEK